MYLLFRRIVLIIRRGEKNSLEIRKPANETECRRSCDITRINNSVAKIYVA